MSHRIKQTEVALSVLTYSSCSISMIILNKLVLNTHKLPYPNSLLFLQSGGSLLIVLVAKQLGLIHFPAFSMAVLRRWIPLTLFFVLMLLTSMKSLTTMSVPALTIIKNTAIIFTAMGDSYLFNKTVTSIMYAAFCLMVIGGFLSVKGDPWVTAWGLFWTFSNIISTVSYTLYMKKLMGDVSKAIGRYGPVFYNNLLSLPFFFVGSFSEMGSFTSALSASDWQAKLCLLIVIIVSSGMTFTVFWCMEMTSPTTFSVVGALNKVPITFLGMFVFNQFPEFIGYIGICVALSGGFLYTYANIRVNQLNRKRDEERRQDEELAAAQATALSSKNPNKEAAPLKDLV